MDTNDKHLGMNRRITRRDFINGIARSAAASWTLPLWSLDLEQLAEEENYPPARTGLRGSHEGSYEVAHQLRDGGFEKAYGAAEDTGEIYDLVVVGAGISGLAAAFFFLKAAGSKSRILILDNHDDFGGHARRQEFGSGASFRVGHGGSFAIESPAPYSKISGSLIEELGIDVAGFHQHLESDVFSSAGLEEKFFFDRKTFGTEILLPDPFESSFPELSKSRNSDPLSSFLERAPWNDSAKKDLHRIYKESVDYLSGFNDGEKKAQLARISYAQYLTDVVKCDRSILPFFQARPHSLYGAGIDIVPAQDAWGLGYPGFDGLRLDPEPGRGMNRDSIPNEEAQKYFFHFPDGNATIARLLVRKLNPNAIPGSSTKDIVMSRARYDQLDESESSCRIRLNSTVVRVKQESGRPVDVFYVRKGKHLRVRASKCVLACWNAMIPYLCPELPSEQKTALAYAIKVPLLTVTVAARNWQPWSKLGANSVYSPGQYFSNVQLAMPLRFEGYGAPRKPEDPILIGMFRAPCRPGLPVRHQHRLGRAEIVTRKWEEYERTIREELAAILGPGGFDPARDITGIAVHRWPHGYAYQYNSIADPFWLNGTQEPCVIARRPFGRIAIANSDAGAYAYVDSAIDQGYRAVQELLAIR